MKTFILLIAFFLFQFQALLAINQTVMEEPESQNQTFLVANQTIEDESEFLNLKALSDNFETIRRVAEKTFCTGISLRNCLEFFNPAANIAFGECNDIFYIELETLCYVYERYIDHAYSVLTTPPDSTLYAQYTANQYVTWKSLNSTCGWVRSITDNLLISSCTLLEIKQACNRFRLYGHRWEVNCHLNKLVNDFNAVRERENKEAVSSSVKSWLEDNLHPDSIGSALLETIGCTFTSSHGYTCLA